MLTMGLKLHILIPSRKWFESAFVVLFFCIWSSTSSTFPLMGYVSSRKWSVGPSQSHFLASIQPLDNPRKEERSFIKLRDIREGPFFLCRVEQDDELQQCSKLLVEEFYANKPKLPFSASPRRVHDEYRRLRTNFNRNSQKHEMLVVQDENGQVCGYCDLDGDDIKGLAPDTPPRPYLSDLAVASARQRQGIATQLMRVAECVARDWGFDYLYLKVDQDNEKALKLYEKLGYEPAPNSNWDEKKQRLLRKPLVGRGLSFSRTDIRELSYNIT